jgi:diguanylate cyclase (GGDEF)-like protein/PAS domain S-box-containing protein
MDNSQDTIYFKDTQSRFILNSRAQAKQFGVSGPEDLLGKTDADFYPQAFAEKAAEVEREVMRTATPIIGMVEKWDRKDGTAVWFSASKYPLYNESGQIVGTWGTSRDVTALKSTEEELERVNARLKQANAKLLELAVIDELSGLFNRRNFDEVLQKVFDSFSRLRECEIPASFCLLLLDIDNFKAINDTYGHLEGDNAIRSVASLLASRARISDYSFRYGGDEYAVILPNTTLKGGVELAERLRVIIENNPIRVDNGVINLTVSVGVSCFACQKEAREMLLEADTNLYVCKHEGKNRVK